MRSPLPDQAEGADVSAPVDPGRPAASVAPDTHRLRILRGELERLRLLLGRYALEAGTSLVMFAGMFLLFAYLGQAMDGRLSPFDADPRVLAVLYATWMVVSLTAGNSASQLAADAAAGVLEGLFLAATPLVRILEMRAVAHALQGLAMSTLLLVAFCLGTHWRPSALVAGAFIASLAACLLTALGLALALSGATLVFKKTDSLMIAINFLCMMAIMSGPARDATAHPLAVLGLPFVAAAAALREALARDALSPGLVAIALVGGVSWLLAGRLVLARCIVACRRRGSTHTA